MPAPYTAIFKEIQTLTTAWLLISAPMAGAGTPADRAVQLSTTIQRSPPSIQLSWSPNTDALDYTAYRKAPDVGDWRAGTPLGAAATSYIDDTKTRELSTSIVSPRLPPFTLATDIFVPESTRRLQKIEGS